MEVNVVIQDEINEKQDILTYIELCAGIGGFRVGIEATDQKLRCLYKNEIDEDCEKTYFKNFGETFNKKDIFDINTELLPKFDLLCAGFPCQPFSIAGNKKGFTDDRGKIYFKISEIVNLSKPKILFLENVSNIINHEKGKTFQYIIDDLKSMNYNIFYKVLDSANFGVPQSRPRVYIVGFNKDYYENVQFTFPIDNGKRLIIRDILEAGDNTIPISERWHKYILLYTNKITEQAINFEVPKTRKKLERISKNCDLDDCIFQIRSSGIRAFSLDGVYPTFAVSNSGGGAMIPVLSKEKRHLSLLEIKRLMGFPDSFEFPVSRTSSIKQLANAVCPPVITSIMQSILKSITT
ncbi:hypothetical protein AN644_01790 [Candidatus Epulonipiscium fishelsonii]|nr:hypothetical protein AN644_01790 [Epulopiscium sp. SCG-C06WGA-EpuloA1]